MFLRCSVLTQKLSTSPTLNPDSAHNYCQCTLIWPVRSLFTFHFQWKWHQFGFRTKKWTSLTRNIIAVIRKYSTEHVVYLDLIYLCQYDITFGVQGWQDQCPPNEVGSIYLIVNIALVGVFRFSWRCGAELAVIGFNESVKVFEQFQIYIQFEPGARYYPTSHSARSPRPLPFPLSSVCPQNGPRPPPHATGGECWP